MSSYHLGQRLVATAQWEGDQCCWIGKVVAGETAMSGTDQPCGAELYAGTAGIGLFLLSLGKATGDRQITDVGRGAFLHALAHADGQGFYEGIAGVSWAALQVRDPATTPEIEEMARQLARVAAERALGSFSLTRDINSRDLISGVTGTLFGLLGVANITGDQDLLDRCVILGQELMHSVTTIDSGLEWSRQGFGVAHGISGLIMILLELFSLTEDQRYLHAATEARHYENSLIFGGRSGLVVSRSHLDLVTRNSWCYGNHGISAARLLHYQLTGDPEIWNEICKIHNEIQEDAYAILCQPVRALTHNLSLCHGLGGAIDSLLLAFQATGQVSYSDTVQILSDYCGDMTLRRGSWICGLPEGKECPGLMLGLAGIGAFMLRLHNPSLMQPLVALGSSLRLETV
jgi:lantibiotic modifying enzyme